MQNNNGDHKVAIVLINHIVYFTTVFFPEQEENAAPPKLVTLPGISMLVSPKQNEYLQPVITQYFASNKSEIWS